MRNRDKRERIRYGKWGEKEIKEREKKRVRGKIEKEKRKGVH